MFWVQMLLYFCLNIYLIFHTVLVQHYFFISIIIGCFVIA